jgi:hypothetical protein
MVFDWYEFCSLGLETSRKCPTKALSSEMYVQEKSWSKRHSIGIVRSWGKDTRG